MPYEDYHINDFVTDPFFRRWILSPDEETNTFWHQWIEEHSDKKNLLQQAAILVKSTDFPGKQPEQNDYDTIKKKLRAKLFPKKDRNQKSSENTSNKKFKLFNWFHLAALISLLLLLGLFVVYVHKTDFEEDRKACKEESKSSSDLKNRDAAGNSQGLLPINFHSNFLEHIHPNYIIPALDKIFFLEMEYSGKDLSWQNSIRQ